MLSKPPARFQFHLRSIFIAVTIACIVFAAVGYWGINGLWERIGVALTVAGVFSFLLDLRRWWKANNWD